MNNWIKVLLLIGLLLWLVWSRLPVQPEVKAILGESMGEGYHGMLCIASGIRNRGTLDGVYGVDNPVVSLATPELIRQAKRAWRESKYNRVHTGTHWENIEAFGEPYWAKGMKTVYKHKNHTFYEEK